MRNINDIYSDFPSLTGFGKCFKQGDSYFKIDITESIPDQDSLPIGSGLIMGYYVPNSQCEYDGKNIFGFYTTPLSDLAITFNVCISSADDDDKFSYMYVNECSERGDVTVKYWTDSDDCSGEMDYWDSLFNTCDQDMNMDGDDDDTGFFDDDANGLLDVDDGDDDRLWIYGNSSELQRCT